MSSGDNTLLARINEILTGFYINGGAWYGEAVKQKNKSDREHVSADDYAIQAGRAVEMAKAFLKEAKRYGFSTVKEVIWTALPGILQKTVDPKNKIGISPKGNPSDLVIRFGTHPHGSSTFLGLSAKSTTGRNKAGIGFKNPGMGKIEKDLGIDLKSILDKGVEEIRKEYGLSANASQRKLEIRRNVRRKKKVDEFGDEILEKIRDKLYNKMKSMRSDDVRIYLLKEWLDAEELYPAYFKVTGAGNKPPFTAKVEDPRDNDKLEAINTEGINLKKVGQHSIQILAGSTKLFNIRAKFDKQKMAGSVVFSADPL
jgi:hypothetical protein